MDELAQSDDGLVDAGIGYVRERYGVGFEKSIRSTPTSSCP
jgi:hypothetical protein